MNWCRLWHDMPNDPKFRTIARLSESKTSDVISVFVHLMADASANATERGRTQPNAEDLASALDLQTERVSAILSAMQGRVLEGEHLTGWDKRQPKREDGGAERSRKWRENKQLQKQVENPNATERNRTQPNAPDKIRLEKRSTNTLEKTTSILPAANGRVNGTPVSDRYESDKSFEQFAAAAHTFWPDLIPEDLQLGWKFTWKKFDFEQKLLATKVLKERIERQEDATYVKRLPKYLENGDWKRPPRKAQAIPPPVAEYVDPFKGVA